MPSRSGVTVSADGVVARPLLDSPLLFEPSKAEAEFESFPPVDVVTYAAAKVRTDMARVRAVRELLVRLHKGERPVIAVTPSRPKLRDGEVLLMFAPNVARLTTQRYGTNVGVAMEVAVADALSADAYGRPDEPVVEVGAFDAGRRRGAGRVGDAVVIENGWANRQKLWVELLDLVAGNADAPDVSVMPAGFPTSRALAWFGLVQAHRDVWSARRRLAELRGTGGESSGPSPLVAVRIESEEGKRLAALRQVTVATEWLALWGITDVATVADAAARFQIGGLPGAIDDSVPAEQPSGPPVYDGWFTFPVGYDGATDTFAYQQESLTVGELAERIGGLPDWQGRPVVLVSGGAGEIVTGRASAVERLARELGVGVVGSPDGLGPKADGGVSPGSPDRPGNWVYASAGGGGVTVYGPDLDQVMTAELPAAVRGAGRVARLDVAVSPDVWRGRQRRPSRHEVRIGDLVLLDGGGGTGDPESMVLTPGALTVAVSGRHVRPMWVVGALDELLSGIDAPRPDRVVLVMDDAGSGGAGSLAGRIAERAGVDVVAPWGRVTQGALVRPNPAEEMVRWYVFSPGRDPRPLGAVPVGPGVGYPAPGTALRALIGDGVEGYYAQAWDYLAVHPEVVRPQENLTVVAADLAAVVASADQAPGLIGALSADEATRADAMRWVHRGLDRLPVATGDVDVALDGDSESWTGGYRFALFTTVVGGPAIDDPAPGLVRMSGGRVVTDLIGADAPTAAFGPGALFEITGPAPTEELVWTAEPVSALFEPVLEPDARLTGLVGATNAVAYLRQAQVYLAAHPGAMRPGETVERAAVELAVVIAAASGAREFAARLASPVAEVARGAGNMLDRGLSRLPIHVGTVHLPVRVPVDLPWAGQREFTLASALVGATDEDAPLPEGARHVLRFTASALSPHPAYMVSELLGRPGSQRVMVGVNTPMRVRRVGTRGEGSVVVLDTEITNPALELVGEGPGTPNGKVITDHLGVDAVWVLDRVGNPVWRPFAQYLRRGVTEVGVRAVLPVVEWLRPGHDLALVTTGNAPVLRDPAGSAQARVIASGLWIDDMGTAVPTAVHQVPIRAAGPTFVVGTPGRPVSPAVLAFVRDLLPALLPTALVGGALHVLGETDEGTATVLATLARNHHIDLVIEPQPADGTDRVDSPVVDEVEARFAADDPAVRSRYLRGVERAWDSAVAHAEAFRRNRNIVPRSADRVGDLRNGLATVILYATGALAAQLEGPHAEHWLGLLGEGMAYLPEAHPGSVFTAIPSGLAEESLRTTGFTFTEPGVMPAARSAHDLADIGADTVVQISTTHTVVLTELLAGYPDAGVYDVLVHPGLDFTVTSNTPDPGAPERALIHISEVVVAAPETPAASSGAANAPGGMGDRWSVPIRERRAGYGARLRNGVFYFASQETPEDIAAALALPSLRKYVTVIADRDRAVDRVRLKGEDVTFAEFARRVAELPREPDEAILLFVCAGALSLEGEADLAEEVRKATGADVVTTKHVIWEMPGGRGVRLAPFTEAVMMGHEPLPPTDKQWAASPEDVVWLLYPKDGGRPVRLHRDLATALNTVKPGTPTWGLSRLPITSPVPWLAPASSVDRPAGARTTTVMVRNDVGRPVSGFMPRGFVSGRCASCCLAAVWCASPSRGTERSGAAMAAPGTGRAAGRPRSPGSAGLLG